MKILNMRVCHIENPLGVRLDPPVFSWIAQSDAVRQAWARIEVFSGAALLLDTGEDATLSSLGVALPLALVPRTRYSWRLTVCADDGDTACETAWFETGKMDEPWAGKWITSPFDAQIHPRFERAFAIERPVQSARAYVVGLGVFELSLNEQRVGDEMLTPYYTEYDHWVQCISFDITALLKQGENVIGALLGNGWYKGRFGFVQDQGQLYGDRFLLLCELRIRFEDGEELVIGSDDSWRCCPSTITSSSIYDGEAQDARLHPSGWTPATLANPPMAKVDDRQSLPVRKTERLPMPKVIVTPRGETVLDFGQILTGWVAFDCDLPSGREVLLRHGELLQDGCFYTENLRSAKQEFRYVSDGAPARVSPKFTFFGFRYVCVEGMDEVDPAAFEAWSIHSDLRMIGQIVTSNEKLNRLFLNAMWSQRGNFLDIPTDCPQRDERMGWTGDAQVFAPTACFNMYAPAFYDKYLFDMRIKQRELNGSVPYVVPDAVGKMRGFVSGIEGFGTHGSCAWGDAATVIPWTLYQFYGDLPMLARQYENMRRWADYIKSRDDERCGGRRLWTCDFHFGDWLALDNPDKDSCLGATDNDFVASAYYFHSAALTAKAAAALGKPEEAEMYSRLSGEIKSAIQREFFDASGRLTIRTQTALALALAFDLAPEQHQDLVRADLRAMLDQNGGHLTTGFVGTPLLCPALSNNGLNEYAYALLLNEDYPGWLYEVNLGATTIWERWNSVLPDGRMSDTGMNSLNHYAYGAIVEWMYRYMAGINPDESAPGFKRATIHPRPDRRLGFVRASYDSASGTYASAWEWTDFGLRCQVEVPFDCEAQFVLDAPFATRRTLTAGSYLIDVRMDEPGGFRAAQEP